VPAAYGSWQAITSDPAKEPSMTTSRPDGRTMDGPQVVRVTVEGGRVRAIEQFVGDPAAVAGFWA
jgi:hypothetical protein